MMVHENMVLTSQRMMNSTMHGDMLSNDLLHEDLGDRMDATMTMLTDSGGISIDPDLLTLKPSGRCLENREDELPKC